MRWPTYHDNYIPSLSRLLALVSSTMLFSLCLRPKGCEVLYISTSKISCLSPTSRWMMLQHWWYSFLYHLLFMWPSRTSSWMTSFLYCSPSQAYPGRTWDDRGQYHQVAPDLSELLWGPHHRIPHNGLITIGGFGHWFTYFGPQSTSRA